MLCDTIGLYIEVDENRKGKGKWGTASASRGTLVPLIEDCRSSACKLLQVMKLSE